MAAPVVYEGVNGKYEGTLFNGIKFWVSRRVPTRSDIVGKIEDNGGKIVELEKYADVLIDDHARKKFCPPGSVSWQYINQSVANGELADIEEHRIHGTNDPRPVGSTNPTRAIKVPYTREDEQILVTWVQRAGEGLSGNEIYKDLAKLYPQHTWQSWRDKWLKQVSLLPQDRLPPVLAELPPPRPRPGGVPEITPAAAASLPKPAAPKPRAEGTSRPAHEPKGRNLFTEEDDRLLTEYVKQCLNAGKGPSGNVIYQDFEEKHPNHSWHSWRDRWLRHLAQRETKEEAAASPPVQPPSIPPRPKPPAAQPTSIPPAARPLPVRPQPPKSPPTNPPPQQRAQLLTWPHHPAAPPASSAAGPGGNGQGMTRLQELALKKQRIQAARTIQAVVRGWLLRRELGRARTHIVKFQARALGFVVRRALPLTETAPERVATASFGIAVPAPLGHDEEEAGEEKEEGEGREEDEEGEEEEEEGEEEGEEEEAEEEEEEEDESVIVHGDRDEASACPPDDGETQTQYHTAPTFHGKLLAGESGSAIIEDAFMDEEPAPSPADNLDRTDFQTAPTTQRPLIPLSPREQFWRDFNAFNEVNDLMPGPWVQIGSHAVDFWDLWRCATAEPHFDRNWGIVGERLGFDWIAEPHLPGVLKAAFEKHLLEFETLVREFERQKWEQGEDGQDHEEGGDAEEGMEEEEEEVEQVDEHKDVEEVEEERGGRLAAPRTADADFVSSPPVLGLKRARRSSAVLFSRSIRKRPRYDLSSEIPETPETRTERNGEGVAAARTAAAGQQTPSRRPRVAQHAERRADLTALGQLAEPDDGYLSPSQQLRSEMEAGSPVQPASQHLHRAPSSADRPLPSVERDGDSDSDSSEAFRFASKVRVQNLGNKARHGRRTPEPERTPRSRRLPWARDNGKGKQPATSTPKQPPRAATAISTATATAPAQPSSTAHARTLTTTNVHPGPPPTSTSTSLPSKPAPNPAPRKKQPGPIDPAESMTHFISQGYPPQLVVRAVKATTTYRRSRRQSDDDDDDASTALANTRLVLDNLVLGRGIPGDMARVWTDEDDRLLREIGPLVDGLRGRVPERADRRPFGDGDGRRVFWRLVGKHGGEGVFDRREFLKVWDMA
ncbi:hypothetical protein N658DRAFT_558714 [Parathielavia hyrcaniae]|uniref:Telomeric repeat-binding factor 2-interacting protein 1 n=1 Tax=Parathielavia hyrcaniae TaxID=113614 RepID=A0AAN6Q0X3_9PEZI|nr:hypothetical protein N658DRAFT_558714 [Parathielavia hyrcaniae]